MKTLVVYDSVWGNTEKIAPAVGPAKYVPNSLKWLDKTAAVVETYHVD